MDLLKTKFYVPSVRPELVVRPRLRQRLDKGLAQGRALTLVSAPAGYGKSTLIAAWLRAAAHRSTRHAWLSLEQEDDEPARFFAYLVAALQDAGATLDESKRLTESVPLPPPQSLFTTLLNELGEDGDGRSLLLVLDDLHKIRSSPIHQALQFWLAHAPPNLHLVLITREDPPLDLARLRARGQITEVRAGDLRFTADEATAFLHKTMDLRLAPADVAALERRTEGWIAGLQLAAIALQSSAEDDVATFIENFSGSHYYVIDYLMEEVLRQQEPNVREFLQQTAVLERLSASLCNAVTGREDGQAILARLERENLFLISLDDRRQWYRYHHLLADSLRAGLEDGTQATLHQRASRWYEGQGLPAAAVRHALATGDMALAADVIERVIQQASAWSRGRIAQLAGWLDSLPPAVLRARPALGVHASRALYLAGRIDQAEALLDGAEDALRARPDNRERLLALANVYRAAIAALHGEALSETIAATRRLLDDPAALDTHTQARAADTLGLAYELRGDLIAAERAYLQAGALAQVAGVRYLAINARCEAAMVQIEQGQLKRAEQTCRDALTLSGAESVPPAGLAWAVLGEIARERNELADAAQNLDAGIALSRQGGITDDLRYAYLYLARLKQAQANPVAALVAWEEANRILQAYNIPRLAALAAAERARLDLAQGNLARARRWAETYEQARRARPVAYVREGEDLVLAQVYLATGKPEAALAIAQDTLADAAPAGRERAVMEALILQALALQAQAQMAAAEASLAEALPPAAREGFLRPFLDAGPAVAALLPAVQATEPAFVARLLEAFGEQPAPAAAPLVPPPAYLVEPLSEREQEVLALLVTGSSNKEIAEKLVITVGTAKWHVHNIYQKLDVGSRAEAIARAHQWHLVG